MKRLSRLIIATGALLVSAASAFGQGSVLQGGPVTPAHTPMYVTGGAGAQTIVQDSGPAGGGPVGMGISELLQIARGTGNPPFVGQGTGPLGTTDCRYDGPTSPTGYHFLCFSANVANQGAIVYGAGGGASNQPLCFIVNGAPICLGGGAGGTNFVTYTPPSTLGTVPCWVSASGALGACSFGAATLFGNPTASGGSPGTAFTVQGLTARGAPDASNDKIPIYNFSTGALNYVTPGLIATSATAGVSSLCTLTGALTATQVTACLNLFSSSLQGLVPASGGGTTNFLRADGSFASPLGTVGTITSQARITLTSGVSVMTTSVAGAVTVFVTPATGNLIPIYNGTNFVATQFAEVSQLTTDATKSPAAVAPSSIYDIFCWIDTGPTNRCTRGPAWTNSTTRSAGTVLSSINGVLVNSVSITNGPVASQGTYIGTIASNASSTIDFIFGAAASGGTAAVLNVWNAYNRVLVSAKVSDTATSWTTTSSTSAAPVTLDASTNNRINFITGLAVDSIFSALQYGVTTSSTVNTFCQHGFGMDTTSAYDRMTGILNPASSVMAAWSEASGQYPPKLGSHFIQALESADGTHTCTWSGNGANNSPTGQLEIMIPM